jgi:flagellar basal-body rod protein FlgG
VALPYGTTGYTRDGSFQVNSHGQVVTTSGFGIQRAITIPANASAITVGRDCTVFVTHSGTAAPVQVWRIQLATFINSASLESKGEKLDVETAASCSPGINTPSTNGAGMLTQGYVKTSNANSAEELVNMIQIQRVSNQQHGHRDIGSDATKDDQL